MTEKEFETKLLSLIKQLKVTEISSDEFVESAKNLSDAMSPLQFSDFEDKELGWAKYWIEEIGSYSFEDVMKTQFDFFEFLKERSQEGDNKV